MKYIGNILYDEKLSCETKKLIIFGAGVYGRRILRYLDINGIKHHVICFCDSDRTMDGKYIDGIPVRYEEDVCRKYLDADYLISGKYMKEMYQALKEKSIEKIHILFF